MFTMIIFPKDFSLAHFTAPLRNFFSLFKQEKSQDKKHTQRHVAASHKKAIPTPYPHGTIPNKQKKVA